MHLGVLEDFLKEHGNLYTALEKSEQKLLNKELNKFYTALVKQVYMSQALQSLSPKPLGGPDVPQRRYHELMADPKLLGSKGKEDFTESVLNTEAIRKQRFTFASSKRMAQTAMEAEAQQSGIGDYPHSTLGKHSFQIGIFILRPHGIALSLHRD